MNRIAIFALVAALAACAAAKDFRIGRGETVSIFCPKDKDAPVMGTAVVLLSGDLRDVLGARLVEADSSEARIVVARDAHLLGGRREAFRLAVNRNGQLRVTGSDAHGVAYGLLEVSRLAGVSPWAWWADAVPVRRAELVLRSGWTTEQSPSVDYRGIFINDEDWGLLPWATQRTENGAAGWSGWKGAVGPGTYARVFELLLRLRANALWPAMHECTKPFFLVEGNRETARRYGIYIGGSHCEPMASSTAGEWRVRGRGAYDYVGNSTEVRRFWEERVAEVAGQPILYTLGMRGVHDGAMQGARTVDEQRNVLERVIRDQRALLASSVDADVTRIPQVFIPYKEVLDVYRSGLDVPADVCLMWCDDNYGYIRHFPTAEEAARPGGNGVYYHVSYWGRPHDYLWLSTLSPWLMAQQMGEAYGRGVRRMWILNVGDIKPAEYQTELFMDMAWNGGVPDVDAHLEHFLAREFGAAEGKKLLPLLREHYRLAHVCRPEFMGGTRTEETDRKRWETVTDLPWSEAQIDARLAAYQRLEDGVERIAASITAECRDTYFQLVKYPVQAAAEMNKKMLHAQRARHGLEDWTRSDAAFDSIASLTRIYDEGFANGGKWRGMMDFQPRQLPVFNRVPHRVADAPMLAERKPVACWNAADMKPSGGDVRFVRGLGYEGKAVRMSRKSSVAASFGYRGADSVVVELRFLPTHPMEGETLFFMAAIERSTGMAVRNYATQGRSEEWKQNVLRNQAVCRVTLPLNPGGRHRLVVSALDEGVILDQVAVYPADGKVDR